VNIPDSKKPAIAIATFGRRPKATDCAARSPRAPASTEPRRKHVTTLDATDEPSIPPTDDDASSDP